MPLSFVLQEVARDSAKFRAATKQALPGSRELVF